MCQVTVNPVPVAFSADVVARLYVCVASIIVSWLSGKVLMFPAVPACVALPAVKLYGDVKCASGAVPMAKAGRSAIHSALVRLQVVAAQVAVWVKLSAGVVASVTFSV